MPTRIIAFDLDGTLVDSVGDIADALNAALHEAKLTDAPVDVDVIRSFVGNGARMLVRRALERVGARVDEDAFLARFSAHYEKKLIGKTVAYPGIADMLADVRACGGVKIAVATNKPGVFARPLVEHLFPHAVDAVLGPDDVGGALKPDPALVRRIEALLEGTVVAFVGDSGVDVATAKNAGVVSVGVTWGLKPDEVRGADRVVDDADALTRVLGDVLDRR